MLMVGEGGELGGEMLLMEEAEDMLMALLRYCSERRGEAEVVEHIFRRREQSMFVLLL